MESKNLIANANIPLEREKVFLEYENAQEFERDCKGKNLKVYKETDRVVIYRFSN